MDNTPENVNELIYQLELCGLEAVPYSGRDMNGAKCVAVYNSSVWRVAQVLWFHTLILDQLNVEEPCTDSLGLGTVVYWPYYTWPESREV